MVDIQYAILQKETELEAFLAGLDIPELKQLRADLQSLKRSKEILQQMESNSVEVIPAVDDATGQNDGEPEEATDDDTTDATAPYLSIGDAAAGLLGSMNKPVLLSYLFDEVEKVGFTPSRKSFRSLLQKDRRKRFELRGDFVKISKNASNEPIQLNSRQILARHGFSLKNSIIEIVTELNGEFTQTKITQMLKERFPSVAEHIQKASVSTTLQVLVSTGLIKEVYEGHGADPKRYLKKTQNGVSNGQHNLLSFSN